MPGSREVAAPKTCIRTSGASSVSGNYEFACLVVVESDDFWSRYGGQIEANWESSALRQYSTRDTESLAELVTEDTWSNEGLFALTQDYGGLGRSAGTGYAFPISNGR